jgi:hypothetical protein
MTSQENKTHSVKQKKYNDKKQQLCSDMNENKNNKK